MTTAKASLSGKEAGDRLRAARAQFRWTQRQAADCLGITAGQVAAIEQERSGLTRALLMLLTSYERESRGLQARPWELWEPRDGTRS